MWEAVKRVKKPWLRKKHVRLDWILKKNWSKIIVCATVSFQVTRLQQRQQSLRVHDRIIIVGFGSLLSAMCEEKMSRKYPRKKMPRGGEFW